MKGGDIGRGIAAGLVLCSWQGLDIPVGSAATPAGFRVATRVPRPSPSGGESQRQPSLRLGVGWGCVDFNSELGPVNQCWDAGPEPRAWTVPWRVEASDLLHDRFCKQDGRKYRCWHRPHRGDRSPREMPPKYQWLVADDPDEDQSESHRERVARAVTGGTFACLPPTKKGRVFCFGDDRFGQLGSSLQPSLHARADEPVFMSVDDGALTLGTWHACALAERRASDGLIPVLCWGRGDHGQFGAPAPDRCRAGGRSVPCARKPVVAMLVHDPLNPLATLAAGDLFTCVTSVRGTQCWGAQRDGLFGVPGSCPASLRQAWPTPDGPVPAPNASCTTSPVTLPGGSDLGSHLRVRPREICYDVDGQEHCLSAVPNPRDPKLVNVRASPGSDASACGMRGDSVICWGEKYSPPNALDEPVVVKLEPLPPLDDMAMIDGTDSTPVPETSQGRQACQDPVRNLPPCDGTEKTRSTSEVLAGAFSLAGLTIRVRGRLGVSNWVGTSSGCLPRRACGVDNFCCELREAPVVIGDDGGTLSLVGMHCQGDGARMCCNVPAYGQAVVATGRLEGTRSHGSTPAWRLANVTVCEVR